MSVYVEDRVRTSLERKGVSHLLKACVGAGFMDKELDKNCSWSNLAVAEDTVVTVQMAVVSTATFIEDILLMHPHVGHNKLTRGMTITEVPSQG